MSARFHTCIFAVGGLICAFSASVQGTPSAAGNSLPNQVANHEVRLGTLEGQNLNSRVSDVEVRLELFEGQNLGSRVSALESNSPNTAVRVVDIYGEEVGLLLQLDWVLRLAGDEWVAIRVATSGFVSTNINFLYEAPDCSGIPLLAAMVLPNRAFTANPGRRTDFFYIRGDTLELRTVYSVRFVTQSGSDCFQIESPATIFTGVAERITLDYSAPFRVVK